MNKPWLLIYREIDKAHGLTPLVTTERKRFETYTDSVIFLSSKEVNFPHLDFEIVSIEFQKEKKQ